VSEYDVNGATRQMFSLDTGILMTYSNASEGWEFVTVKRPSGAEVLFPLQGTATGKPDNPTNNYTMAKVSGSYELTFPASRYVVHRFAGAGSPVGALFMKDFAATVISGPPWPGMTIDRTEDGHLHSVDSPVVVAEPSYAGDLISFVAYKDHVGTPLRSLAILPGSRILRSTDANGNVIEETRLMGPPSNRVTEIWYGVSVNPVLTVAKKEMRTETVDSTNRVLTRLETTVLNPDTAGAVSNMTATVFQPFAWGDEAIRTISGFGGVSAQTTVYTYGTNTAASNSYSHLTLVEQSDGGWTRYEYDDQDRETAMVSPFKSAAPAAPTNECLVRRYYYAGDALLASLNVPNDNTFTNDRRPRLILEKALDAEIGRTYQTYFGLSNVTKRCRTAGAAYDAADNLTTMTRFYADGDGKGRPARVEHDDGTLTVYSYSYNSTTTQLVTITDTGVGEASVTTGVRSISIEDAANRTLFTETRDIATELTLSAVTNTYDALGRVVMTSNRVSGVFSESTYACCDNPESTRDEEGISTEYAYDALKRPFVSTRLGVATYRTYDVLGNVIETRLCAPGMADRVTRSAYDSAGRLRVVTNELGTATRYFHTLNAAGERVETMVYANGSAGIDTYYRDGRLKSQSGAAVAPRFYNYGVDADGAFTIEYHGSSADASEWVKTYANMLGQTWKTVYPGGYTQTVAYDAHGRPKKNSDGSTTTLTAYNAAGEPFRTAVDMDGNDEINLDGRDRVSEMESSYTTFDSQPVRETVSRVYPTNNNATPLAIAISRTAVDGSASWSIAFGRTNRSEIVRNVAATSRVETVTAPDGTQIVSCYTNGLLMAVHRKTGSGNLLSTVTYTYDAFGRSAQVNEPAANGQTRTTTFAYDAAGNVTSTVVAAGSLQERTTQTYDAMGRRTKTVLPDGGEVLYSYTLRGEVAFQGGARTYPVTHTYDDQGRMTSLSTYRGGLAGAADTTTWAYDAQRGWPTAKIFANGTSNSYEYLSNGQLKKRTWARGVATAYAYDAGGNLTNIAYSGVGTPAVSYTLDRLGRLAVIADATGVRTNNYAADGRLLSVSLPQVPDWALEYAADPLGRIIGVVITNAASAAAPYAVAYAYDSAGRLASVDHAAGSVAYAYAADGHTLATRIYSNGTTAILSATNVYDGLNRLAALRWQPTSATAISFDYAYNAAGQRTTNALGDGSRWVYRYDELGQVIAGEKRWNNGVPVGGERFEYAFDTIGNRVSARNAMGTASLIEDYTANALNQYTARTVPGKVLHTGTASTNAIVSVGLTGSRPVLANRQGAYYWQTVGVDNASGPVQATNVVQACMLNVDGGTTNSLVRCETNLTLVRQTPEVFTYDADGNLTADGLWANTWDAENRLVTMESGSGVPAAARKRLTFQYDDQGRRTTRQVESGWTGAGYSQTNTTTYVYDGWNMIAEVGRGVPAAPAATNYYVWGLDLSGSLQGAGGIGGLLGLVAANAGLLTPSFDGNGNVTDLIDASGTLAAHYEYSPFGETIAATRSAATHNPFRFSTKYTDDETGLAYYGLRYYSPGLGRWLSRDPIGDEATLRSVVRGKSRAERVKLYRESLQPLYLFVHNEPITVTDILGLSCGRFIVTYAEVAGTGGLGKSVHGQGYNVSYNGGGNCCAGNDIKLVQAIKQEGRMLGTGYLFGTRWHIDTHAFPYEPGYTESGGLSGRTDDSLRDSPGIDAWYPVRFYVEVCAICAGSGSGCKKNLGCTTFSWNSNARELEPGAFARDATDPGEGFRAAVDYWKQCGGSGLENLTP
jgi:RHS repeat-associated protein